MVVVRYETMGTPVADPDGGPFDIGYDNIESNIVFLDDEQLADFIACDPENLRSVEVIAEQPSFGL